MIFRIFIQNLLLITILMLAIQCTREPKQRSINYPNPVPDSISIPFLPGIVSSDSLDFNACFSSDGKRFYFSRSGKGKWMIYMTELNDGAWSIPVLAPFTEKEYSQADPFIARDGTLYYISNRPRHSGDTIPDYDIWFIRPQKDGSWTKPEVVEGVNSDSTEYYVSLAANGNLYFASNRAGTMGSHDIYVSPYRNGIYSTPENLGMAINSEQMEHDPMISPDEQCLIFTSVDRADSYGSGDLYYSIRNKDGTWAAAKNMGSKFNTDTYEYCSYVTPDNEYLFFSTNYDVKWISAKHLPWMTPSNLAE
jgi:Tol biopolymer transport system component